MTRFSQVAHIHKQSITPITDQQPNVYEIPQQPSNKLENICIHKTHKSTYHNDL